MNRCRGRLYRTLYLAARTKTRFIERFIISSLVNLLADIFRSRLLARVGFLPLGFCGGELFRLNILHLLVRRPGRSNLPLRTRNIRYLPANLTNQLRFFKPVLLLLLVEDRPDAAVGIVRIPAQVSDILLLVGLVTNHHATARHRRLGGALCMPFITQTRQRDTAQIGQQV